MGEIADWMHDQVVWNEVEHKHIRIEERWAIQDIKERYNSGVLKWRTKAGETINVNQMTKQHIKNTINVLKRRGSRFTDLQKCWIEIFELELERRQ